jgi:hypothetical protein
MNIRMKKLLFLLMIFVVHASLVVSQNVGVKTNFAHWAAIGTPNLGVEFALNRTLSLEISGGVNLWEFDHNRKAKHWLVQPEIRHWFCETFNGHFIGLHALASEFNMGGLDIPFGRLSQLKEHRYEGFAYGVGLSYGHQWVIGRRWNLEASIGAGYAHITFDKFPCVRCGEKIESGTRNYFGITKAAVSLIFFIN